MSTSRMVNLDAPASRRGQGPVRVRIPGRLAERVRDAADASHSHSAASWALEAIEYMLDEHRSGRYRGTPMSYSERARSDWDEADDLDIYG